MNVSTLRPAHNVEGVNSPLREKNNTLFPEVARRNSDLPVNNSTFQFLRNINFLEERGGNSRLATTSFTKPIIPNETSSINEQFQFKDRTEVLEFIVANPDILNLYKSLHVMIESVFGAAKVRLSVFKDFEEEWSNLRVEIESDHEIEELTGLENKLFDLIERDSSFTAALDYVTISCG